MIRTPISLNKQETRRLVTSETAKFRNKVRAIIQEQIGLKPKEVRVLELYLERGIKLEFPTANHFTFSIEKIGMTAPSSRFTGNFKFCYNEKYYQFVLL